jgi:hypothetical protein
MNTLLDLPKGTISNYLNKAANADSHHYALCTTALWPVSINTCLNKSRQYRQPPVCIVHPCTVASHYQYLSGKADSADSHHYALCTPAQ